MIHFSATVAIAEQRRTERQATAARTRQLRQARPADAVTDGATHRGPRRWSLKRVALTPSA
jgi:hypothetical protein